MIYKTLKKVSDYCQLLDKSKYPATQTINGVTFTNNGDGTITANGTATAEANFSLSTFRTLAAHKYLLIGSPANGSNATYYLGGNHTRDLGAGFIASGGNVSNYVCCVTKNCTANNLVFKPQLFDLTEMYGAGNEPITVAEFRTKFPNELYDYKPYCFVKSYKNCLKVSDYCQLMDKSKFSATATINGVTFTNNGDGSITVNGTASANTAYPLTTIATSTRITVNHKYLYTYNVPNGSDITYYSDLKTIPGDKSVANSTNGYVFYTANGNDTGVRINIRVFAGYTADNLVFKPQLFDLTEMYGSGNEPTTVEQFRADFPNELYDYKPYSIVPSYKKSLKVSNSILL